MFKVLFTTGKVRVACTLQYVNGIQNIAILDTLGDNRDYKWTLRAIYSTYFSTGHILSSMRL